jgi:hypothetical protein
MKMVGIRNKIARHLKKKKKETNLGTTPSFPMHHRT